MFEPQNTPIETYESQQNPIEQRTNPLLGIIGALLFSLGGVALYVIVYQLGFIAGIVGFAIFWLAYRGFDLFGKCKGQFSVTGLAVAIVVTIVMLLAAEYASLVVTIYREMPSMGFELTISESIDVVNEMLKEDAEIRGDVIGDLAFSFIFAAASIISHIVQMKKQIA